MGRFPGRLCQALNAAVWVLGQRLARRDGETARRHAGLRTGFGSHAVSVRLRW